MKDEVVSQAVLDALLAQALLRLDALPGAVGIYALADHLGQLRYIGSTSAQSFRDRIGHRHVTGSEDHSHKLSWAYNIGRMWRDRKAPDHVPADAKVAKALRTVFIRRHCRAVCVPLALGPAQMLALEADVRRIAPADMVAWNDRRLIASGLSEPGELVDALIEELGLPQAARDALDRQARVYDRRTA